VEFKNDESMAVLVGLGAADGLNADFDFEVLGTDGTVMATIYPRELHDDRFWSQPLARGQYDRIELGMSVRSASLDRTAHREIRRKGEALHAELQRLQELARKESIDTEIAELREKLRALLGRRDALERRIPAADAALLEAEGRMDSVLLSEESDIDRDLEGMEDLVDQREELQSQREILAEADPFPRDQVSRLTDKVKRLNDRIAAKRRRIRLSRERSRTARSSYLSRRREWKELVAEKNAVATEIHALTDRIGYLSSQL
jgi:chromosome segregation ATPase